MTARSIAFFVPSLGGGGAEMHVLRLANFLSKLGHKVRIFVARKVEDYGAQLRSDVDLQVVGVFQHPSTLATLSSRARLRVALEELPAEIIFTVSPHASIVVDSAIRHVTHPPLHICCVQNNPDFLPQYSNFVHRFMFRARWESALKHASGVVAISHGVKEKLEERVGALDEISVIYNAGVDDEVIFASEDPVCRPRSRKVLVACGRLVPQKDYPTLLRAIALIRHQFDVELWVLGRGREHQRLRRLTSDLSLTDRVVFHGFVENPFAYMAAADLFVLSSRWEGFGNVLVEALACGTPVISTDCPFGPREVLPPSVSTLVPCGDPMLFSRAVCEFFSAKDRQWMAAEARRHSRRFHIDTIGAQYDELVAAYLA